MGIKSCVRFLHVHRIGLTFISLYIALWWAPIRPLIVVLNQQKVIPLGINGPLEWMARWWLNIDSPVFFQPLALLAAVVLGLRRRGFLEATWSRTINARSKLSKQWVLWAWAPFALVTCFLGTSFLGHITPLTAALLTWLPVTIILFIYGPRVTRVLHVPCLLLVPATALPDTLLEKAQQVSQNMLGLVATRVGRVVGDNLIYTTGNAFNVNDDYLIVGSLNAPISAPLNGLSLLGVTTLVITIYALEIRRKGLATTTVANAIATLICLITTLMHLTVVLLTLHFGIRGRSVASFSNVYLVPLTSFLSLLLVNYLQTTPMGKRLERLDKAILCWFQTLPDLRSRSIYQKRPTPYKQRDNALRKAAAISLRFIMRPFRRYWRIMSRLDEMIGRWEQKVRRKGKPR